MGSKVTETSPGTVQALIDSEKGRDMRQYSLKGIDFEAAVNGVIATLRFRMKPEVETKLSKKSKNNYVDYESKYCEEKLVFEGFDPTEVSDFLVATMKQFKESKTAATDEKE